MYLLSLSTEVRNGVHGLDRNYFCTSQVSVLNSLKADLISLGFAGAKTVQLLCPELALEEFMNQYGLCLQSVCVSL